MSGDEEVGDREEGWKKLQSEAEELVERHMAQFVACFFRKEGRRS